MAGGEGVKIKFDPRHVADYAARIVERIVPNDNALRQRAFLAAVTAIEEGRDAESSVQTFVRENA
jgi:3-methyladenine DNA glycosylase Tag